MSQLVNKQVESDGSEISEESDYVSLCKEIKLNPIYDEVNKNKMFIFFN